MQLVVWDPKGKYAVGTLVEDHRKVELEGSGVALMPIDDATYASGAGVVTRYYGAQGVEMPFASPGIVCPVTLHAPIDEQVRKVHWKARCVAPQAAPQGNLRLSGGGQQLTPGVVSSVDGLRNSAIFAEREKNDGGWTVGGTALLQNRGECACSLGLYGFAPGVRILWLAVTLSR